MTKQDAKTLKQDDEDGPVEADDEPEDADVEAEPDEDDDQDDEDDDDQDDDEDDGPTPPPAPKAKPKAFQDDHPPAARRNRGRREEATYEDVRPAVRLW